MELLLVEFHSIAFYLIVSTSVVRYLRITVKNGGFLIFFHFWIAELWLSKLNGSMQFIILCFLAFLEGLKLGEIGKEKSEIAILCCNFAKRWILSLRSQFVFVLCLFSNWKIRQWICSICPGVAIYMLLFSKHNVVNERQRIHLLEYCCIWKLTKIFHTRDLF